MALGSEEHLTIYKLNLLRKEKKRKEKYAIQACLRMIIDAK